MIKLRYMVILVLMIAVVSTACDSGQDMPPKVSYEVDESKNCEEYYEYKFESEEEIEEYAWEYLYTDETVNKWLESTGMTPGHYASEYGYATDMELICEELENQGYCHEFEVLFRIADEIGYCPSAILGKYCIDKETQTLHLTDCEECVKGVPYENMSFAFEYRELEKSYSGNICEMCFAS